MRQGLVLFALLIGLVFVGLDFRPTQAPPTPVERGRYLVQAMGCADCHTPLVAGPEGPRPDPDLVFAGHPASLAMPAPPRLPAGPWRVTASGSLTAWSGPWGVSFSSNLTPDVETGLGAWTEQTFVDTLRTGRHMGSGRPLLPPMPTSGVASLRDDDLRAVFAYLHSLPAIHNPVPPPMPPSESASASPGSLR